MRKRPPANNEAIEMFSAGPLTVEDFCTIYNLPYFSEKTINITLGRVAKSHIRYEPFEIESVSKINDEAKDRIKKMSNLDEIEIRHLSSTRFVSWLLTAVAHYSGEMEQGFRLRAFEIFLGKLLNYFSNEVNRLVYTSTNSGKTYYLDLADGLELIFKLSQTCDETRLKRILGSRTQDLDLIKFCKRIDPWDLQNFTASNNRPCNNLKALVVYYAAAKSGLGDLTFATKLSIFGNTD